MNQNADPPEENQRKQEPGNIASHNSLPVAGAITQTKNSEASPEQKTRNMEVHHHGHVHEKKKWKEYIFQFVMLFAAVFLGSFAETTREDIGERHKEREYMESMVADIKKDTAEIRNRYSFIYNQIQAIDNIKTYFTHDLGKNPNEVLECYKLSYWLFWYASAIFNESTISQLISSGNMRLIKKDGAADNIMEYYNAIKRIEQQKQQYLTYLNMTLAAMYKVYDVSFLNQPVNANRTLLDWPEFDKIKGLRLRTTDLTALKDLSATLETTKLVIHNYMVQLGMIGQQADTLILFLKEEYNIKKELK